MRTLIARERLGGILRSSRTLGFFFVWRAIDIKDLKVLCILCGPVRDCLKQDGQDEQDVQDEGDPMHRRQRRRCAARRAFVSHGEKVGKTLMSIEKRVSPFFKGREDLN